MMVLPERLADWFYWGGGVAVLFSGFLGIAGGICTFWGDRSRDHYDDQRMSANELQTENAKKDAAVANKAAADAGLRAAEAEQRAAEANQRAAEAGKQAAEAELRAAEANEKAEKERIERLKLEEKLAPRVISPDEQQSIGDKIRPFGPRVIDIFSFHPAGVEIARFHNELVKAIANGGWTGRIFGVIKPGFAFRGIVITTRAPVDPNADTAADALASALSEIGIPSTRRESLIGSPWEVVGGKIGATVNNPWNPANIAQIVVMIGEKR